MSLDRYMSKNENEEVLIDESGRLTDAGKAYIDENFGRALEKSELMAMEFYSRSNEAARAYIDSHYFTEMAAFRSCKIRRQFLK